MRSHSDQANSKIAPISPPSPTAPGCLCGQENGGAIHLVRLCKAHFDAMYDILENSFPADERRSKEGQRALFDDPRYVVYGAFAPPAAPTEKGPATVKVSTTENGLRRAMAAVPPSFDTQDATTPTGAKAARSSADCKTREACHMQTQQSCYVHRLEKTAGHLPPKNPAPATGTEDSTHPTNTEKAHCRVPIHEGLCADGNSGGNPSAHSSVSHACTEGSVLLGFISLFEFSDFQFVEHFAVAERARGSGLGGRMLEELLRRYSAPFYLEVEPPEGVIQRRRIGFYERHGFTLNHNPYLQPAYGPGRQALPLLLMSTGGPMSKAEVAHMKAAVYPYVYHVKPGSH